MISDGSLHSYMKTKEYKKEIKNQSLWNTSSTVFTKKRYPVSEKISQEVDRYFYFCLSLQLPFKHLSLATCIKMYLFFVNRITNMQIH